MLIRQMTREEANDPSLLPIELRDWQFPYLDEDWCWITEKDGEAISLIITSFVHGVLFFWRILSTKASLTHLLFSLPRVLENAKVRGCVGYASFLHDNRPAEVKLARIIQNSGGVIEEFSGMLAAGTLYGRENARSGSIGDHRDNLPDSGGSLDGSRSRGGE